MSASLIEKFQILMENIRKNQQIRAESSYFRLPQAIINTTSCVNIKNYDKMCFKWCILLGLMKKDLKYKTTYKDHLSNVNEYQKYQTVENIKLIEKYEYPMDISNFSNF